MKTFTSDISKKEFPEREMASGLTIIHPLLELIQRDHPDFILHCRHAGPCHHDEPEPAGRKGPAALAQ